MESSDSFKVIVIILSFMFIEVLVILINFLHTSTDGSCNPILIPFSQLLYEKQPSDVLKKCMNEYTLTFMDDFTQTFRIIIRYFTGMGFSFINIIDNLEDTVIDILDQNMITTGIFKSSLTETLDIITDELTSNVDGIFNASELINGFVELLEDRFDQIEETIKTVIADDRSPPG